MNDFYRCGCSLEEGTVFPCGLHQQLTRYGWEDADKGEPMTAAQAEDYWRTQRQPVTPLTEMTTTDGTDPELRTP